jgi:CheY-like chemotaxis protein
VAGSKSIKLLLVEDDLEDEQFLSEALTEIEENHQWCNWMSASVMHVEQLADALDCLRADSFDAVLLNLTLPDNPVLLDIFHQVNACARATPIVILADREDPNLANRLLREGAQDVLLKSELECASLARSLRYAVERQHRVTRFASAPFADSLTGTLSGPGFLTLAAHSIELSRLGSVPLLIASLEISEPANETAEGRDSRELLLLRAAEILGAAFQPPALVGRLGRSRFGVMTAGFTETTLNVLLNRAALAIQQAAKTDGMSSVTVRFSVAPVDSDAGPEDTLGQNEDEFARSTHRSAKTVMLAD